MGGKSSGFSRSQHGGTESRGCGSIALLREVPELGTAVGCGVQVSPNLSEHVFEHLEHADDFVLHAKWGMAKLNMRRVFGNQWFRSQRPAAKRAADARRFRSSGLLLFLKLAIQYVGFRCPSHKAEVLLMRLIGLLRVAFAIL